MVLQLFNHVHIRYHLRLVLRHQEHVSKDFPLCKCPGFGLAHSNMFTNERLRMNVLCLSFLKRTCMAFLLHHDFDTLCRNKTETPCLKRFAAMRQRGPSWWCCTDLICLPLQPLAASCINLCEMRDPNSVAALRFTSISTIKDLYDPFAMVCRLNICIPFTIALLNCNNFCWVSPVDCWPSVDAVSPKRSFMFSSLTLFHVRANIDARSPHGERLSILRSYYFWHRIDSSNTVLGSETLQFHMTRVARTTILSCPFWLSKDWEDVHRTLMNI